MWLNKISIRTVTIANLAGIGIALILLSIYLGTTFKTASLDNEKKILERITKVSADQIITKLKKQTILMGESISRNRELRTAIKNPQLPENKESAIRVLDDQFSQRWVTAEILDLVKIRIYDKNMKFLTQSSRGKTLATNKMPTTLFNKANGRSKRDRLKTLSTLWKEGDRALLSTLLPVGGLRLVGYMEIVSNPAHNLREIEALLKSPMSISNIKEKSLYTSKAWDETLDNTLIVNYVLKTDQNEPLLNLRILENIEIFNDQFNTTQLYSLIAFVVIMALAIVFSIAVFNKFAFTPLKKLIQSMEKSAQGDLTTKINTDGLSELGIIGMSLRTLVESLHTQMSEVQKTATELSSSSVTLNQNTNETNNAVQQQLTETDQVATAIAEMSATVQEVSANANQASDAAKSADSETVHGQEVVEKTIQQINSLSADIDNTSSVIVELKNESENIGSVMTVIQGIAEQTNLLALNAAIEAARAGEQGRGFAVVADEVRTLANRTQDATQNIQAIIEKVQSGAAQAMSTMEESKEKTQTTVEQAALAGESLKSITDAVNNILEMNIQISNAATEQTSVASAIGENIESINGISQRTADGATKISNSGDEMEKLSIDLQHSVEKFKL